MASWLKRGDAFGVSKFRVGFAWTSKNSRKQGQSHKIVQSNLSVHLILTLRMLQNWTRSISQNNTFTQIIHPSNFGTLWLWNNQESSGMFESSKPNGLKSILILFRFLILAEHLNSIPIFARDCRYWGISLSTLFNGGNFCCCQRCISFLVEFPEGIKNLTHSSFQK